MQQVVAHLAMQVGAVVQGMHLMDTHAPEALRVGLDGIEHRHGLAVGQRHDQIVAVVDQLEDILRATRNRARPGHEPAPVACGSDLPSLRRQCSSSLCGWAAAAVTAA